MTLSKFHTDDPKMLGASVQNFYSRVTVVVVHPCYSPMCVCVDRTVGGKADTIPFTNSQRAIARNVLTALPGQSGRLSGHPFSCNSRAEEWTWVKHDTEGFC